LRGDDGAGLEAVRRWRDAFPDTAKRKDVRVELAGLAGLSLLDMLADARAALLVDCVRGPRPAGSIHRLDPDQLAAFSSGSSSAHGWGVAETLALAQQLNLIGPTNKIRILAIEAGTVAMGPGLSPEIMAAMPSICEAIEAEVQALLR
jgi:hydrogenase maturation protease